MLNAITRCTLVAVLFGAAWCGSALGEGVLHAATIGRGASVPDPTVEGPIGATGLHDQPANGYATFFDLGGAGYTAQEYFLSGTARARGSELPTGPEVQVPVSTAAYKTRVVVRRPVDPRRFNGTVVVEWFNVTAGQDFDPVWIYGYPELLRGYAFVGVSAQLVGVNALRSVLDPLRYQSLSHPGDQYSMDIFSQALKAIASPRGINPLGPLHPRRILAAGESQSGGRLHDYIDLGVQREARLADGFLLDAGGDTVFAHVPPDVPVLQYRGEEQAVPGPRLRSRNYRIWWVAGASHLDAWGLDFVRTYLESYLKDDSGAHFDSGAAGTYGERGGSGQSSCNTSPNQFPEHYAMDSAVHALSTWVRTGRAAPGSPEFTYNSTASTLPNAGGYTPDGGVVRDAHGNIEGGLRLPPIDVPVAEYRGNACVLLGYSIPFDDAELHALYPTFGDYYARMNAAATRSMRSGYLLPYDARDLMSRVCDAMFRWRPAPSARCS